jgi:Protein of unknown function (DUF3515)
VADPVARSAARIAALVAVPVALLVGVGSFAVLRAASTPEAGEAPSPTPVATGPVEMAAPPLTDREEIVCRALLSQLPAALGGLAQRPVTAGPEQNTAYGEPPVTVACGGPAPAFEPTDQLHPWQGVCWHPAEGPAGSVWTVLGREVPVRVSVPTAYDGPFQLVLEFSRPVAETVRSAGTVPAGCRE